MGPKKTFIDKARKWLPEPSVSDSNCKDPAAPGNWKDIEPQSEEEMRDYMQRERNLILRFLLYWEKKAFDEETKIQKEQHENALKTEWAKWEPYTSIQNGEIHDQELKQKMLKGMGSVYRESKPPSSDTKMRASSEYRDAQCLWEDFLYFQNAWNRRRFHIQEDEKKPQPESKPRTKTKKKEKEKLKKEVAWRDNLIRLYTKWNIGDRSKLPESGLGPEQLHMYSDNIRHTAKNGRLSHLQEHFPISELRLNSEAIEKRREEVERIRKEKEKAQKDTIDTRKYAVVEKLPEGHQPYFTITERSLPWQYKGRRIHTSWESSTWAPAIANKIRVLGEQRECHRPRYETLDIPRLVAERGFLFDKVNNRRQVDADGNGLRGDITRMVFDRFYKLDKNEQRILLRGPHHIYARPHYTPAGTVTQVHSRNGQYTARREAHFKFAPGTESFNYSDAEEERYEDDQVSLPDVSDEAQGPSDGSEDEESDDEGDLFARAYKQGPGLLFRSRKASIDSEPGSSGSGDPSDGGDGPPRGDPPPGSGGGTDTDDDNDDNSGTGKKVKKRDYGMKDERFENDTKNNCRWVECTYQWPDGFEFTQRDRIPALTPGAKELYNAEGGTYHDVYPKGAPIPVFRGKKYKGVKWKKGDDGVFRKKDLTWRPAMILRKFRRDTGRYEGSGDLFKQFPELIRGNLPDNLVRDYNKAMRQYINRGDDEVRETIDPQPHWTDEEIAEAVRFLNDIVRRRGLLHVVKHWDDIIVKARDALDEYRTENMKELKRGSDSTRTKFARSDGLQDKLKKAKALNQRTGEIPDAELKPHDYFTAEDFAKEAIDAEGTTKKKNATKKKTTTKKKTATKKKDTTEKKGTTAKKRTFTGKVKRKTKIDTEEESGSEAEDATEGEIEDDGKDDEEKSAGEEENDDESEVLGLHLRKKRKM
ncbi:hypothetical protein M3J09_002004 [Ascochyta lentis]